MAVTKLPNAAVFGPFFNNICCKAVSLFFSCKIILSYMLLIRVKYIIYFLLYRIWSYPNNNVISTVADTWCPVQIPLALISTH